MRTRERLTARWPALIAANRATERRFEVSNAADGERATVYLYDLIDPFWGVSAAQFVKELAAITAPNIDLRINSPGGDVFDGRAIATAIREHRSNIVAHIDGIAASAASFIALAAREVIIAPGAMVMIHRASSLAWGNAEDLSALAAVLEKIDESLVAEYARETGQDAKAIRDWLDAETYFTAEEAVAYGFADSMAEGVSADNRWNLEPFGVAPAAPAARAPVADPAPDAAAGEAARMQAERERRVRLTEIHA